MSGFGAAPLGTAPYGVGTPSTTAVPAGTLFKDPNSTAQFSGKLIDPRTHQYVYDPATGLPLGMTKCQQIVYLAANTVKKSSVVAGIGHELGKLETIGDDHQKRVYDAFSNALADAVRRKLITLLSVDIARVGPSGTYTHVRFKDLTTGLEDEVLV